MSGIIGIVNFDGAPVDASLLSRMSSYLSFRGPDAKKIWIGGAAGLGHTLLRTTDEADREEQPFTLDGQIWIVADARIDARSELISKLNANNRQASVDNPDVELILHAYQVWGQECVEHLLGDFGFAIWDSSRRRLFCARDHMGVKPFYYTHIGSTVIFSNTLDCIRLHPAVSNRLNDLAVADFLLFGHNQEKNSTTFADIQRIAPAHCATWTETNFGLRRYWTMPIDGPVYYRRQHDYADRFNELLREAVNDRLRTDRAGVFMSGGLDSPTLAATAHRLLRDRSGSVRAFTFAPSDREGEGWYAARVALKNGFPISFLKVECETDPLWTDGFFLSPEPIYYPMGLPAERANYASVASYSRVALYGEGPDNALTYEWRPYVSYLTGRRQFGRLVRDVCSDITLNRRIPLLQMLPRLVIRRKHRESAEPYFPTWLNSIFDERFRLHDRWSKYQRSQKSDHPLHPVAYGSFEIPLWQSLFESLDAGRTLARLEVRHPYIDLRLLRYLLSVPAIPWCRDKYLIRAASRGLLPEEVLSRPKMGSDADPVFDRIREAGFPQFVPFPGLEKYVDAQSVPSTPGNDPAVFWIDFCARSLNYWLHGLGCEWQSTDREDRDELATSKK